MSIVKSLYDKTAKVAHWQAQDKDWSIGGALSDIIDPSGGKVDLEITSIPSPLARIDLIKSAFNRVNNKGHQIVAGKGDIYDKMVSETLDVGQIFFNAHNLTKEIEIIEWNIEELKTLLNGPSKGNKMLARTLKMYLNSDYGSVKELYLLKYRYNNAIIGMTSPATLFCSSANDLSFVKDIHFGENTPFSGKHVRLRDRNPKYIKWLYALTRTPNFYNDFRDLHDYIKTEVEAYGHDDKDLREIRDGDKSYEELYTDDFLVTTQVGDRVVKIVGYKLRRRVVAEEVITGSGFEIMHSKHNHEESNGRPPLVLPNEAGNTYTDWKYTYDQWGNTRKADKVEGNWWERKLPQTQTKYPYLSIDDFLEDHIVRPYAGDIKGTCWNSESFFDGNYNGTKTDSGYLLPITDKFFTFFSAKDLRNGVDGNKKIIEMEKVEGGSVRVILRIPVRNGFVEYKRLYEKISSKVARAEGRYYIVSDYNFDFLLFPNIRFTNNTNRYYRAIIVQSTSAPNTAYKLEFRNKDGKDLDTNTEGATRQKEDKGKSKCMVWVYDENADGADKGFDYIRIHRCGVADGGSGIVVPNFKVQEETPKDRFVFAIDFGTTNTHILYSVNDGPTSPLDIKETDKQLAMLTYQLDRGERKDSFAEQESANKVYYDFMPSLINGNDYFPLRTALNIDREYNYRINMPKAYVNANVAFNYGKNTEPKYDMIETNLKWSGGSKGDENEHLVTSYIESIMLLLRNKVILNGGKLDETKIVWFYPVSMPYRRMQSFTKIWTESYERYFGSNTKNVIRLTESMAPYYNYEKRDDVDIMATVDIGGGTTDIVWAKDISNKSEKPAITSFRFAANAIFSNGFDSDTKGGIVERYQSAIGDVLTDLADPKKDGQKFQHLKDLFDKLSAGNDTSEMAAFLFSLIENKDLPGEKRNSLDYGKKLSNDSKMRVVFVIFFSAIIYHIAQLMKANKVDIPDHISFSGNGSKTVKILSDELDTLGKFATLIFEKVYGKSAPKRIVILQEKEPKKVTCDGGIKFIKDNKDSAKIDELEDGLDERTKILKRIGVKPEDFEFFTKETYKDVKNNDKYKEQVVDDVANYFKCIFDDLSDFIRNKLLDSDAIGAFEHAKELCLSRKQLAMWLNRGITKKTESEETNEGSTVEETFFFYPIVGALRQLADEIHKKGK